MNDRTPIPNRTESEGDAGKAASKATVMGTAEGMENETQAEGGSGCLKDGGHFVDVSDQYDGCLKPMGYAVKNVPEIIDGTAILIRCHISIHEAIMLWYYWRDQVESYDVLWENGQTSRFGRMIEGHGLNRMAEFEYIIAWEIDQLNAVAVPSEKEKSDLKEIIDVLMGIATRQALRDPPIHRIKMPTTRKLEESLKMTGHSFDQECSEEAEQQFFM